VSSASVVACAAAVCLLNGCLLDSNDEYVYYVTTSDGSEVVITTEGFGQQQTTTPWESPVFRRADGDWVYLEARRLDSTFGSVVVRVTKNGETWLTETSNGKHVVASVEGTAH